MKKLKVKIKSYDPQIVDQTAKKIAEAAKAKGFKISGPVPLPTKKEIFTILRSTHIYKKAREQFEIRTHKRLVVIISPSDELMMTLKRMELPAGVDVAVIAQ